MTPPEDSREMERLYTELKSMGEKIDGIREYMHSIRDSVLHQLNGGLNRVGMLEQNSQTRMEYYRGEEAKIAKSFDNVKADMNKHDTRLNALEGVVATHKVLFALLGTSIAILGADLAHRLLH